METVIGDEDVNVSWSSLLFDIFDEVFRLDRAKGVCFSFSFSFAREQGFTVTQVLSLFFGSVSCFLINILFWRTRVNLGMFCS